MQAPVLRPHFRALMVRWSGDGVGPVKIHVSDRADFEPDEESYQGTLHGTGFWSVMGLRPGRTYYARLVDSKGAVSPPSVGALLSSLVE